MRSTRSLLLALCVGATACKANDGDTALGDTNALGEAGGSYGGTATGTVEGAPEVLGIRVGRAVGADMRMTDERSEFAPSDPIIVLVETRGAAVGQAIEARLLNEAGDMVETQTGTVSATGGSTSTQLQFTRPGGWSDGRYRVVVTINKNEVGTREIEVKQP